MKKKEKGKSLAADEILSILDCCCDAFTFPMLDNGYVYPAASRMSLYRSAADWAMVIEIFGYSPRAGSPDTHIYTFASRLHDRDPPEKYTNRKAYDMYLTNNPNNESRFVFPVEEGAWQDNENGEFVSEIAREVIVRDLHVPLPPIEEYGRHGIDLEEPPRIQVFELCRFLASTIREQVLATPAERRMSVLPDLSQIAQFEEWRHPDLLGGERPSNSTTFQRLAQVLDTGNLDCYRSSTAPNTHWSHWPEGGRL